MLHFLNQWQLRLGLVNLAAILTGAGLAIGLVLGLLLARRSGPRVAPSLPAETPVDAVKSEDQSAGADQRRNPRRPGRSVEVFVALPGSLSEPCKGVVLDRAVGGLKLLVGDPYPVGSKISVLPASASKLTPWVEVVVKSCRKSGEDWEIGVQFVALPPYATMVQFG